jgi:6-phospho-beta-glucosidase
VATGYHRIALDVMNALCSDEPRRVVINVRNHGAVPDVAFEDVVEAPCAISKHGIVPEHCGPLPEDVRGLVLAVKAYERAAIDAAVTGSAESARKAMLLYPSIGEWEPSADLLRQFSTESPAFPVLR